ncbi:MAG: hypothetical protein ACLS6O_01945 [Bifidobacterium sp.]
MPNEVVGNKPKLDKIVYKQMADTASSTPSERRDRRVEATPRTTSRPSFAYDAQLRIGYSTKTRAGVQRQVRCLTTAGVRPSLRPST